MRLWGYFDASGNHSNKDGLGRISPSVTVAGYLASAKQWERFDKYWKGFLAHYQVPYLHMTDFVARKKIYKDWLEEKRAAFLKDAVWIIKNNTLCGIGMSLSMNDYKKIIAEVEHSEKILGKPYLFCAQRCFESAVDYSRKINYNDSIKYIFESGDQHQHEVFEAHNQVCKDDYWREFYRFSKGALTFKDGVKNTPLQAADFLAHELYKEMHRIIYSNESKTYTRGSLVALFGIDGIYKYYVEEHLIGYLYDFIENSKEKNDLS